jgi:hypothetical protein
LAREMDDPDMELLDENENVPTPYFYP